MEIKYIEEELNSIDKTLVKAIFYKYAGIGFNIFVKCKSNIYCVI